MNKIVLKNGREICDFTNPYIIAEVNSSHNGNIDVAKMMIDVAADAGCDCVKFQSWSSKSLYSKTYYEQNPIAKRFVEKFSLTSEELYDMSIYCKKKGVDFSSTPYSEEEVDFLVDECKVPFIKISSMEINNPFFLQYIAKKSIPIIMSTGMSSYDEVRSAINMIEAEGNNKIAVLHCVSLYPTKEEYLNLKNIEGLRNVCDKYPVGFSDHSIGDTASVIATAMFGAAIIEKHITLDSSKIGMDNQMAMQPEELKKMVFKCRSVRNMIGTCERVLLPDEIQQRDTMRRSLVVTRDMKKGDTILYSDLTAKRPGNGIEPTNIQSVIGHKLINDVYEDTMLQVSDFV